MLSVRGIEQCDYSTNFKVISYIVKTHVTTVIYQWIRDIQCECLSSDKELVQNLSSQNIFASRLPVTLHTIAE